MLINVRAASTVNFFEVPFGILCNVSKQRNSARECVHCVSPKKPILKQNLKKETALF